MHVNVLILDLLSILPSLINTQNRKVDLPVKTRTAILWQDFAT